MKHLLLISFTFFLFSYFSQTFPKRELRGAWVSTVWNVDYPSASGLSVATQKSQFIQQITELQQAGINVVYIQVRPSCDAFYASSLEPWSQWLTGTPQNTSPSPYYDPLVFYVDECHKRGMELHAWVNPYRAASSISGQSFSASHVTNTHPSWCVTYGTKKILNPGLTAVRNYVTSVVMEIVRDYDVDGIHFDDYFYPYPEASLTFDDAAAFVSEPRGFTNLDNWRRDNVNIFINQIHDSIKAEKPWVRFGVSPFGIWKSGVPAGIVGLSSYFDIYCDPIAWLQQGNVDYILPQLYWVIGGSQDFTALSNWWGTQCQTYNRNCFAGMATYRLDPSQGNWANSEIKNQVDVVRSINSKVPGFSCFSSKSILNNLKSIQDTLAVKDQYVSLLPPMTWDNSILPNTVSSVSHVVNSNSVKLTWTQATSASDGDLANYYVIYRFLNGQTIDLTNPVNIAGRTHQDTIAFVDNITLNSGDAVTYVITSVDRYSNESGPYYYNICYDCDNDPPNSSISTVGIWKTANFSASFTDIDPIGGTGVEKGYYNVENFNGSKWIANGQRGFAVDDFESSTIGAQWVAQTGTWNQTTGEIVQNDEALTNTNLHLALNQSLSNQYVYDFTASIGGTGTNRRAGVHIFATDPTLSERGNSLLIWFRLDDDKIQLYQTNSNLLGSILFAQDFNFNADQMYDFRIIYDRITGKLKLFIDGNLIADYTFSSPYATGDYVSFRSGNSAFTIQDFKVLRSRSNSVNVTVGSSPINELIYQNPNPITPSGRIHSFCIDSSSNMSTLIEELVNVDYTLPQLGSQFNDSLTFDIDSIYTSILSANWDVASDSNSAISNYEISFGTSFGATDIQNWTSTTNLNFESLPLTLIENQQYFANLRAINGAGLVTDFISTDGVVYLILDSIPTDTTTSIESNGLNKTILFCFPNPTVDELQLIVSESFNGCLTLASTSGELVYTEKVNLLKGEMHTISLKYLPSGNYFLQLEDKNRKTSYLIIKN
jgi:uncharacterized lipoprotein YddW (UPF0748 family)